MSTSHTPPQTPPQTAPQIPAHYLRSPEAPPIRTLVDIITTTAQTHPDAPALDDGEEVLTYEELINAAQARAADLQYAGIPHGGRVGIRMPSGNRELYIAILGTLFAGCAYVPVDADDPQERADLVFGEAHTDAIITMADDQVHITTSETQAGTISTAATNPPQPTTAPHVTPDLVTPDLDAWIIFTSGSTGKPKGVAVTHRNAAAFVDAEAELFLANHPTGPLTPGDRVLAGLSVAFDASCEEMWLAWRNGACLVPAPRALVRSGVDLGPWLISRNITAVSTVPTLAALWPDEALDNVRLLIFGGEACPPELAARLATPTRELWNTYGPTEATVVACGTTMDGQGSVSIGLPLRGWDLAVVDSTGHPVAYGEVGELIIGGVGLARYLDPAKDAEKFAPMPTLGWERAYRSGDHVRLEADGLYFVGRIDDQVKIGGRRIELGEIDAALTSLPNVRSAAVVVQTTGGGDKILVGYVAADNTQDSADSFDLEAAQQHLKEVLPAAMVPRLCVLPELPVTTSGKVDKKALPWPLPAQSMNNPGANADGEAAASHNFHTETERWLADLWTDTLGTTITDANADFFNLGGTSLGAATMIARVRTKAPTIAVRDLYDRPRLGAFAEHVHLHLTPNPAASEATGEAASNPTTNQRPTARPVQLHTRMAQALIQIPAMLLAALRWVTWILIGNWALHTTLNLPQLPETGDSTTTGDATSSLLTFLTHTVQPINGWVVLSCFFLFATPLGRLPISALLIRATLSGLKPGTYPRGGLTHLRLWAAERIAHTSGAHDISGASWNTTYARWLGARIGHNVQLHTLPPITGMLSIGNHTAIEPEVDLSGYWIQGDQVHIGAITIGENATIGTRTTLLPGATIGDGATIEAASCVTGDKPVKPGARWAGSPAKKIGKTKHNFPTNTPPRNPQWRAAYALGGVLLAALPMLALITGTAVAISILSATLPDTTITQLSTTPALLSTTTATLLLHLLPAAAIGGLATFATYTALIWILVRLLSIKLQPGITPVRSYNGWRIWFIERLMDNARTHLFPLYAAQLTPWWFRSLGAKIGRHAEISTTVMVPAFADVREGAFLADDTMVGGYELGGRGWMRTGTTRVGKRSFLGNSGIAGPERNLKKNSLVAVLSSTPKKTKAGTNWIGSPPERLRRRVTTEDDEARTYNPGWGVKTSRGIIETLRLLAPMTSATIAALVIWAIQHSLTHGLLWATITGAFALIAAGFIAAITTILMKWICVGRIKEGEHQLWSPFVWLNELQDQFVETVAGPWFLAHTMGTGSLNMFMRALGASVGRGAWLDTYWLPEADLVHVGRGATVGPGCVVQTHLFQDRIMSLGPVTIADGATLGPHSVALPASQIGAGATVGAASLIMRGDHVPAQTSWQGNPIEPMRTR